MEIQEDFLTQSQPLSTHMSTKGKLYIVGDSFTEPPRKEDNYQPWFSRLGTEMNLEVVNCSGMGTSQDFALQQLSGVMHHMTKDDKILWLLTHAARFWFFDNRPRLTNANIMNIDEEMTKDEEVAVRQFMLQIQRPPLDLLWQDTRLGWLSAHAKRIGMQAPQIVQGFPRVIPQDREMFDIFFSHEQLDNLRISKGDLLNHVEAPEMIGFKSGEGYESAVWQGYDCRYNHLVKSNHDILLERMITAYDKDLPVDLLTPGWTTAVIDEETIKDPVFIEKELDSWSVQERLNNIKKMTTLTPWADKVGISKMFSDKK